ncbi:SLAC1 anion channel family protein [Mameliella alba]|uniref:SLAC1 anion channel family protein n=1 Tax=Mameliella alba TaxID=561184 RepID=UPI0021BD4E46|nr:SLAC1 anion channel family protein [Mameliella alba]
MTDQSTPHAASMPEQWLAHFPITLFASVMGLSGLALALHVAAGYFGWGQGLPRFALAAAAADLVAVTLVYALKALRHPEAIAQEWAHPVKLNFFPAIPISLMLVATALRFELPAAALWLWGAGAALQAVLALAVIAAWMGPRTFGLRQVNPAWFIPAVGNVVVPVAGVPLGFVDLSWLFYATGVIFWAALLPILLMRLVTQPALPGRLQPTLAILVAPPSVAFLSWLLLNGGELDRFARVLFNGGLAFGALATVLLAQAMRPPFALSWWALSFPVAALTISCLRYAQLSGSGLHGAMGAGLLVLLVVIVTGLVGRTVLGMTRREICRPE